MIRARKWVYNKAIDPDVDCDIDRYISSNDVLARIPAECHDFLRNNKQVVCSDERIRFMRLTALREAVIAGKADDWGVVDFNFETDEATFVCVYCVTGVEHPDDEASSVKPPSSTLH
jgi:hypothetical protein